MLSITTWFHIKVSNINVILNKYINNNCRKPNHCSFSWLAIFFYFLLFIKATVSQFIFQKNYNSPLSYFILIHRDLKKEGNDSERERERRRRRRRGGGRERKKCLVLNISHSSLLMRRDLVSCWSCKGMIRQRCHVLMTWTCDTKWEQLHTTHRWVKLKKEKIDYILIFKIFLWTI